MSSFSFRKVRTPFRGLSRAAQDALGVFPGFAGVKTAVWIASGLLLVALVYLAQSSNAALIARNQTVKEARLQELKQEDALLRLQIAEATSPPTIEKRARALGLAPAQHVVYSSLPDLRVDMAEVMPAFAPRSTATQVTLLDAPAQTQSPLGQILALFGVGSASDSVEAQSR